MIIGILLFTLGFFVAWFAKPNGATWRTVLPPEDVDRGAECRSKLPGRAAGWARLLVHG